jgi:hypothetical protein
MNMRLGVPYSVTNRVVKGIEASLERLTRMLDE